MGRTVARAEEAARSEASWQAGKALRVEVEETLLGLELEGDDEDIPRARGILNEEVGKLVAHLGRLDVDDPVEHELFGRWIVESSKGCSRKPRTRGSAGWWIAIRKPKKPKTLVGILQEGFREARRAALAEVLTAKAGIAQRVVERAFKEWGRGFPSEARNLVKRALEMTAVREEVALAARYTGVKL